MKQKYDIARLHADCLAWCESPTWKPWLKTLGAWIPVGDSFSLRITVPKNQLAVIPKKFDEHTSDSAVLLFANLAGLDVESYRLPEIDRDQAVRDYLAGIPEGGELVDGWVKQTNFEPKTVIVWAVKGDDAVWLVDTQGKSNQIAYTFLRLDLKES